MKKSKSIYLFILPLIIVSCDMFDKFEHFGIGNTFDKSFTVDIPFSSNMSFEGAVEFAATDDATIKDNIDNIQEFEVTQISLKITNYTGNAEAIANGSIFISSDGTNVGDPVSINNLNFAQMFASDELLELDLTSSTYAAIKTAYLNNQTLTVEVMGDVTGAREDLQVEFTIYMSIEATIKSN